MPDKSVEELQKEISDRIIGEILAEEKELKHYRETVPGLREALRRIAEHEHRADRRHRGMVDVDNLETLKRIARNALRETL